ncbi:tetratricopeptide repeat protein [Alicyclobacillus dauci]|uniref:Tetratricopeptide repeat protein n=1 Tax=Alicyclobacillus dauci TaxID=1475485 RepID=A0ABY6Z5B9_9BACL|nr:hypothetical protein [Alicyclobacillus dauci]WAH38082.1 hypothetical protein NZD86_06225 [Alicyclobacillus dauci]
MADEAELGLSADRLVENAVDTIRERASDDGFQSRLVHAEQSYVESRTDDIHVNIAHLDKQLADDPSVWPMRLYLADAYLQLGNETGFEREVGECLARSKDPFVVVSLFMFMTRLYVLRAPSIEAAVRYVRSTLENNPSVAPYVRSIYIQTLLEAGDFEEAYNQLQTAVAENNPMLTIEGLEILPNLMARLERWQEEEQVIQSLSMFAQEQLTEDERFALVRSLVSDVQEREQLSDLRTARFLMNVAREIDEEHPDVTGYLSIGVQMPKGWWPVQ